MQAEGGKSSRAAAERCQRGKLQQEELEKSARSGDATAAREWRSSLHANETVHVARFGQPGRVVRIDLKKNVAIVGVGLGQWEVPLDELTPIG